MNDQQIIFSPEHNQWTLTDGRHHMEVPEWAREIMRDEFERETRPLQAENDKLRELVRDYIDAPCTTCDCWQDEFRCWNYDGADCGLVARARDLGVEVD